jgi:DnaA family protein
LEQLVFELAPPEPPRLSNFLPGRNGELVAALTRFVSGAGSDPCFLIWGAPGTGKTHLLRAAMTLATEHCLEMHFHEGPGAIDSDPARIPAALVAIDRIDEADPAQAGRIFTLYNALRQRGGRLVAASRLPLATLALREDLRTRLGWGLVYEVLPLADDEKPEALAAYARGRGFDLSAEVIDYLLRHGRRDMPSLLASLAALDRFSLAAKRPITVPLLRQWLQESLRWDAQSQQPGRND